MLDEHPTELLEEPVDLQRATFPPAAVGSGRHSKTASLGMTSVKDDFDVGLREHITGPSSDA